MASTNYTFAFSCRDNGGKYQHFDVKARDRFSAEKKAFEKARKNAAGDITSWDCKLKMIF